MGEYHVTLSQCHNSVTDGHGWSRHVTVTVCHMTRVTWELWKSKRIVTVVKCISSREISENSIEFSLSNSEQRDSWLNSGHRTLDTDSMLPTSTRVLSVRRGQPSHKGLPLPLRHLEADYGTTGRIDRRFNSFEGCSRGKGSGLHPREGFCLVWPVKSAPWSLLVNKFAVLNVEEVNTDICEPICKGTTLGQCLVMWVGSYLRATISPIAFPCLSYFPFCVISCDSSKSIIRHSMNICHMRTVPWQSSSINTSLLL